VGGVAQAGLRAIRCDICERGCLLGPGRSGACGLYEARDGQVVEIVADRYLAVGPLSIETMPLLHHNPGAKYLQISTTGCNFDCPGCISTVIARQTPRHGKALTRLTPELVVEKAIAANCLGVAFLMNDPLASLPTFLRVAALAKARGLEVGCSTNCYFTAQSLERLLPLLDFINIGLKGFSEAAYHACGGSAGLGPVWRNLRALVAAGVHVELSVIYARDKEPELVALARAVAAISPRIPLQLMRFIPFEGAAANQEPAVRQAEAFCARLRDELAHVYLFNTPGTRFLDTVCPACGHVALRREFYGPMGAKLLGEPPARPLEPRCPACGAGLDIVGQRAAGAHQEEDFQGGYPFTRALEMVEAMVIAMGSREQSDVVRAWERLLAPGGLKRLHQCAQEPRQYIDAVRWFGAAVDLREGAEALAAYLEAKLDDMAQALAGLERRPTVYYAMAKPLFYLSGGRLENRLVELAGGVSLNKLLPPGGRPGRSLSVDRLNELDPEVIFISAFLSNTVEDFLAECRELGVEARAVRQGRVHAHPAPGWDFGSPRWVLGLMHIARTLHPELVSLDVMAQAQAFYRRFYGLDFSPGQVNRSFAKPAGNWRWPADGERIAPAATEAPQR